MRPSMQLVYNQRVAKVQVKRHDTKKRTEVMAGFGGGGHPNNDLPKKGKSFGFTPWARLTRMKYAFMTDM
jgi:hypothetical protein